MNGGDFIQAENLNVRFEKGETTKSIALTPRIDNEPEISITYIVKLMSVEGKSLKILEVK